MGSYFYPTYILNAISGYGIKGVGMTQIILDSALLYYNRDFTIDVPITPETIKLHSKLHSLGFEALHHGLSKDHVSQITYIKDRNLGWI